MFFFLNPSRLWRHILSPFLVVLLFCGAMFSQAAQAQSADTPHSDAALISETRSIAPATPFTVALRLKMEKHWHSYWINPGDSGLATTLKWTLPAGFKAGPIQWPHPQKIFTPPLMTYGYEDEVWLLTEITPPTDLPTGKPVTLSVEAKWLICKEACLPAKANLKLSLPVESTPAQPDARWSAAFERTRAALPITNPDWKVSAERAAVGNGLVLRIQPPAGSNADWLTKGAYFFVNKAALLEHAAPQKITQDGGHYLLHLTPSPYASSAPKRLGGILLAPEGSAWNSEGARALAIDVPVEKAGVTAGRSNADGSTSGGAPTLPLALLLALGGGLLLNLMPCVFPVLSLKILGFAQQSGEDRSRIKKHGFAFGAGVLLSFWALAGVLLLLRAGGGSAGWGFQLQSPLFVASLVLLLFLVGLNLLGAFEIGVSLTRLSVPRAAPGAATSHSGYGASFWSGVLATVVATPCTAPFMGSALAFALTQPAGVALLVFTFLGLGMALPYVVLSLNPAWIKKLPRPGAWMETFKQLMAFPIFATALWLLAVFGLQTGVEGMSYLLGALLLLGLAIWVWRRWGMSTLPASRQLLIRTATLLSLLLALAVAWSGAKLLPPENAVASDATTKTVWQPYSPQKVEAALDAGKPVFIDFTAAWCITCQVNKRTTLRQPEILDAFAKRGVVLMSADWTRRDAEITAALERYGRNGVPTYVLLTGKEVKPQVLPEVLSHSVVLNALDTIQPRLAADAPNP